MTNPIQNQKSTKAAAKATAKKIDAGKGAPETPKRKMAEKVDPKTLPVTDPRRKLTKEERKALTPEQRKARKAAIRAKRGPAKVRLHKVVMRMHKNATRFAKRLGGAEEATTAVKALLALAGHIDTLPADWSPAKGGGGERSPKFEVGAIVQVKKARRDDFDGLIPSDELDGLVVKAAKGKEVLVQAEGGTKLFIAARHLELAAGGQG